MTQPADNEDDSEVCDCCCCTGNCWDGPSPTPVMISIYLPTDSMLEGFVRWFEDSGFEETEWCELTHDSLEGVVITYAPCEGR